MEFFVKNSASAFQGWAHKIFTIANLLFLLHFESTRRIGTRKISYSVSVEKIKFFHSLFPFLSCFSRLWLLYMPAKPPKEMYEETIIKKKCIRRGFLVCLQLDLKILYYTLEQQFVFVSCSRWNRHTEESGAKASDWTFRSKWMIFFSLIFQPLFYFPSLLMWFFRSFFFFFFAIADASCQRRNDICLTS